MADRRVGRAKRLLVVWFAFLLVLVLGLAGPANALVYSRNLDGYIGQFTGDRAVWTGTVFAGETAYVTVTGGIVGTSSSPMWVGWECGPTVFGKDFINTRAWVIAPGASGSAVLDKTTGERVCAFWLRHEGGGTAEVYSTAVRLDRETIDTHPPPPTAPPPGNATPTPDPSATPTPTPTATPSRPPLTTPSPSPSSSAEPLCWGATPSGFIGPPVPIPCPSASPSASPSAMPANTCVFDWASGVNGSWTGSAGSGDCNAWSGDTGTWSGTQRVLDGGNGEDQTCRFAWGLGVYDVTGLGQNVPSGSGSFTMGTGIADAPLSFRGLFGAEAWQTQGGSCLLTITWDENAHHVAPTPAPSASGSSSSDPSVPPFR